MNKQNKGITINEDDQDWGSAGLENYLSQSLISSPKVLDANLSLLDKEDKTRSSKVDWHTISVYKTVFVCPDLCALSSDCFLTSKLNELEK